MHYCLTPPPSHLITLKLSLTLIPFHLLLPAAAAASRPPATTTAGIFEGIARIEAQAYQRLHELGASRVTQVYTAGGGAVNAKWTAIRARELGVPVRASANGDASYGAALLAMRGAASTTK